MMVNSTFATVYPRLTEKISGGYYTHLLDDPSIVRILSHRCFVCDASLTSAADLYLHHNLAHGLIPRWFSQNFALGLRVFQLHLLALPLVLSDQAIYQLCQILILRIHCATRHFEDGDRWLHGDARDLGQRTPKRAAETISGGRATGSGEKAQRHQDGITFSRKDAPDITTNNSDDDDPLAETRRLTKMPSSGLRVCGAPQPWSGQHPEGLDADNQRLAGRQAKDNSTSTLLGNSHDDLPVALQIPEAEGLTREQRAQAQCHEVQPPGWIRETPISQLEWGTEKTSGFQDSGLDAGRHDGHDRIHQIQHGRSSSHTEIPQSQEVGWRFQQGSSISMEYLQQGQSGIVATSPTIVASQLLATHPDESSTWQLTEKSTGEATSISQKLSLRIFRNSTGRSCYINSTCLGLAWIGLVAASTPADWSDGGFFLRTCVHPALMPLDVHHSFQKLLGSWLTDDRINRQHDVHEFAQYLISHLRPNIIDMTWCPKWTLEQGPAMDQNLDDYSRGGKWDILSLALPENDIQDAANSITLQDLINLWHDGKGMCNVFTTCSRGKLLHVNRQLDAMKSLRPITITDSVMLPHAETYQTETRWVQYSVHALTYHLGQQVVSGHYRSAIKQIGHSSGRVWMDYEDMQVPTSLIDLTETHCKNVTLVWRHQMTQQ